MILQLMIKSVYLHHLKTEDPWCNGSTPDFGSVCRGSNPCGSTITSVNQYITDIRD